MFAVAFCNVSVSLLSSQRHDLKTNRSHVEPSQVKNSILCFYDSNTASRSKNTFDLERRGILKRMTSLPVDQTGRPGGFALSPGPHV